MLFLPGASRWQIWGDSKYYDSYLFEGEKFECFCLYFRCLEASAWIFPAIFHFSKHLILPLVGYIWSSSHWRVNLTSQTALLHPIWHTNGKMRISAHSLKLILLMRESYPRQWRLRLYRNFPPGLLISKNWVHLDHGIRWKNHYKNLWFINLIYLRYF